MIRKSSGCHLSAVLSFPFEEICLAITWVEVVVPQAAVVVVIRLCNSTIIRKLQWLLGNRRPLAQLPKVRVVWFMNALY